MSESKTNPLVTLGMPVYNGGHYIREALDSILAQEYEHFELIISDNASDDETESICREYAQRDPRVQYHRQTVNQGAAANYNRVFELAHGKYFKWATHDDQCLPRFLTECVGALEKSAPDIVLVYPRSVFIDGEGQVLHEDEDDLDIRDEQPFVRLGKMIARVNMVNAIFGLFRSDFLARTRLIDRFIASDYVFMAEIALLGKILEIPEVLFQRRHHERMSMLANRSNKERRSWFDPKSGKSKGRLLETIFPRAAVDGKLIYEWERSVNRMPLSTNEKLLCYPTVPLVWYWRRFRCWGGLQRWKLKQFLGASRNL